MPPSTGTTSSPTILSSSYRAGAAAPITHAPFEQGRTPTLKESSPAKRHTPSFLEKHSHPWSTSPSDRKEMKPSVPKYSTFEMHMTKLRIWPKTWPTSRNCITTCAGKNRTLYKPSLVPMPSTTLSHASFTMPRQPQITRGPCLTPALMTLRMGGNMAPSNTTSAVSGAKGTGTPHITAHASISACSATGTDIKNSCVVSPTRGAGWEECAASPTTTRG
jgi:hypothetical protein